MQQYILFHNQIREEAKKKGQERAYKVQEAGGLDLPVPLPLLPSPPLTPIIIIIWLQSSQPK